MNIAKTEERIGKAIDYIPAVLAQLDADGREMLTLILQVTLERGYRTGFKDVETLLKADTKTIRSYSEALCAILSATTLERCQEIAAEALTDHVLNDKR